MVIISVENTVLSCNVQLKGLVAKQYIFHKIDLRSCLLFIGDTFTVLMQ